MKVQIPVTSQGVEVPAPIPEFSISVRDLVEFVWRRGNLGGTGAFISPSRAQDGARAHRQIQKSRPAEYQSEITVRQRIETVSFKLTIQGRIDGMWPRPEGLLLEEIKTVEYAWDGQPNPLHWAQARIYGWLLLSHRTEASLEIQLTYFDLLQETFTLFRESFTRSALEAFYTETVAVYGQWLEDHAQWCSLRDHSLKELAFPYPKYRPGQRAFAIAVYKAIQNKHRLFAEAPTGIGKTISTLYPAMKSLAEGQCEKLFYLTAKTVGRTLAESSLKEFRKKGARIRSVTLTARDKICFGAQGKSCDASQCPFAIGYFDRVKPAIQAALALDHLNRENLEQVAKEHTVCPFELSLDCALWVDVVIGDYNYLFDPRVRLKRFFGEESGGDYVALVDEAHNLLDRARQMFSADLTSVELLEMKRKLPKTLNKLGRKFAEAAQFYDSVEPGQATSPAQQVVEQLEPVFIKTLEVITRDAAKWLARNEPSDFRDDLLNLYFRVQSFLRTADGLGTNYRILLERINETKILRLWCVDPAPPIMEVLECLRATIYFSATLTPIDFYRRSLGGRCQDEPSESIAVEGSSSASEAGFPLAIPGLDPILKLPSPFPRNNLKVLVADRLDTRFRMREKTVVPVARSIEALVAARTGNYLIFFPSYAYLESVGRELQFSSNVELIVQTSNMSDEARSEFLERFHPDRDNTVVGMAVLGGIFGEGIDLVGERLIGVVVVGVGLPQITFQRDVIRNYFSEQALDGFDHAYLFPGLNRVTQAAGRVIRTEEDRGVVLLIDDRFGTAKYRELLPEHWEPRSVRTAQDVEREAKAFWIRQSL